MRAPRVDEGELVGRDEIVASLREGSAAGVVRICGPPGIGKSRLLGALRIPVVTLRHATDRRGIDEAVAVGLGVGLGDRDGPEDLRERLRRAVDGVGGVVALDDAEGVADEASQWLRQGGLRGVVSARTPAVDALCVPPLTPQDARTVWHAWGGRGDGTPSSGSPLAIRLAAQAGVPPGPLGEVLDAAWRTLPPPLAERLAALAAFTSPVDPDALGVGCRWVEALVVRGWILRSEAGLVLPRALQEEIERRARAEGSWDGLAADHAEGWLERAERRRAWRPFAPHPGPVPTHELRTIHLRALASGQPHTAARAVLALVPGAIELGASAAVPPWVDAVGGPLDPALEGALGIARIVALKRCGAAAEALHHAERLVVDADAVEPVVRAWVLLKAAEPLAAVDLPAALRRLDEAEALADRGASPRPFGAPDDTLELRAEIALTRAMLLAPADADAAHGWFVRARDAFRAVGDARQLAIADAFLLASAMASGRLEQAATILERGVDALHQDLPPRFSGPILAMFVSFHLRTGRADALVEAERASAASIALAEAYGDAPNRGTAWALQAIVACVGGRLDDARRAAERAVHVARRTTGPHTLAAALSAALAIPGAPDPALARELAELCRGSPDYESLPGLHDWLGRLRAHPPDAPADALRDAVESALDEAGATRASYCAAAVLLTVELSRMPRGTRIAEDGTWFSSASGTVDLSRRAALQRVLSALATRRRDAPGRAAAVDELFALGWPGERARADSARNRVYVSIARLRELGLRSSLVVGPDGTGFLLDPASTVIEAVGPPPLHPSIHR